MVIGCHTSPLYWQPSPRKRLLPWLADPGNLVMSPHVQGKKAGTRHTEQVSENMDKHGGGGECYKLTQQWQIQGRGPPYF